ncbi:PAS domain-containing protein [Vibrio maerlii]|uniref:PAS domain-containing protein n=1 Tax=Vibrio maerlii TaxID=2231648 RepID=UPI000E3D1AB2|nr:PAS domain-containing protein [Vibrio maerlii]
MIQRINELNPWMYQACLAILASVVFILDLTIPLGVAAGVPYITVILFALITSKPAHTFSWAIICTLLTLAGFYLSPFGGEAWKVVSNRILAIYAIWIVAIVSLVLIHKARNLAKAESDLAVAEFRSTLGEVAEYATDAIIITDAKGLVTWVNKGFTNISGYTLDEVINKKPGDILQGPETDLMAVKTLSNAVKSAQAVELEIINYHKSGTPYWIDISITPVFEKGELVRFVAVERDITKRKQLELRLESGVNISQQANTTKTHFMALMAHEISGPLSDLNVRAKAFKNESSDTNVQSFAQEVMQIGESIQDITTNLNALSCIDLDALSMNKQAFSLTKTVNSIATHISQLTRYRQVHFIKDVSLNVDSLYCGDEKLIHNVFYFFALNTITSMNEGVVQMRCLDLNQENEPTNAIIAYEITVDDNGKSYRRINAINHSDAANSKQVSAGMASCFQLANEIIKQLNGRLSLEHLEDKGQTRISITLPLAIESNSSRVEKPQKRVLVAEDNRVNAMILMKFLKNLGFESIDHALNGAEAIELTKRNQYYAIFMDNHMPVMTGTEATDIIISQVDADANIIACTADTSELARQEFINNGANAVIYKPLKKSAIEEVLMVSQKLKATG